MSMSTAAKPSTRSRVRSDNGRTTNDNLTQISKLFPKQNASTHDGPQCSTRKRTSDAVETGASPVKRAVPAPKPKENVISKFFHREEDEDDDFESPKKRAPVVSKRTTAPKVAKLKKTLTKRTKATKSIKDKFFSAAVTEHCDRDGVDPDEMQLALAMSQSLATGRDDESGTVAMEAQDASDIQTNTKSKAVHEIFRRFGFRTGTGADTTTTELLPKRKPRNKRNNKCTALTRRDPVAQYNTIKARCTKIVSLSSYPEQHQGNPLPYQIGSELLGPFHVIQNVLFELNAQTNTRELHEFYTNDLCEVSSVPAGVLLRDWNQIPGRERTPDRLPKTGIVETVAEDINDDAMSSDSFVTARSTMMEPTTSQLLSQSPTSANVCKTTGPSPTKSIQCIDLESSAELFDEQVPIIESITKHEKFLRTDIEGIVPQEMPQTETVNLNISKELFNDEDETDYPDVISVESGLSERAPSPDMFADDDSDNPVEMVVHSISSDPPCSLDPEPNSASPQSTMKKTEEEFVIDLYSQQASLLKQLRSPMIDNATTGLDTASPDSHQIRLNYSGASDVLSPQNHVAQQQPNGKTQLTIDPVDVLKDKENISGTYTSQTGIEVFETFHDEEDVKIGEANAKQEVVDECIEISDDDSDEDTHNSSIMEYSQRKNASLSRLHSLYPPTNNLSQTLKIETIEASPVHSPLPPNDSVATDEINFSFDSVASELENTLPPAPMSLLRTSLINSKRTSKDLVELAVMENLSFPNDDVYEPFASNHTNVELNGRQSVPANISTVYDDSMADADMNLSFQTAGVKNKSLSKSFSEIAFSTNNQNAENNESIVLSDDEFSLPAPKTLLRTSPIHSKRTSKDLDEPSVVDNFSFPNDDLYEPFVSNRTNVEFNGGQSVPANTSTVYDDLMVDGVNTSSENISGRKKLLSKSFSENALGTSNQIAENNESILLSDDEFSFSINISKSDSKLPVPDDDSIEISDDEINYSMSHESWQTSQEYISKPSECPAAKSDSKLTVPDDESIEISDDEINYSMSHESWQTSQEYVTKPSECPAANDSLQQIYDEDFEVDYEVQLITNDQPQTDDADLVNQSVRSIVQKDFVRNTNPSTSSSIASTPLRRTTSDVMGFSGKRKMSSFKRFPVDAPSTSRAVLDNDIFDDLIHGLMLPASTQIPDKSTAIGDEGEQFSIKDNNRTNPSTSSSIACTTLRKTASDVMGFTNKPKVTSFKRFPVEAPSTSRVVLDNDSFDDLMHGLILPVSTQIPEKSTAIEDEKFRIKDNNGAKFDVKIGPRCVTPKPKFETFDSPTLAAQLKKNGLRPLARRKAIICLEHIYNRTHPFVTCPGGKLSAHDFGVQPLRDSSIEEAESAKDASLDSTTDKQCSKTIYTARNRTTRSLPDDFFTYFLNEQSEYILPSGPRSKRLAWCLQPLHIAWYNLLNDNPGLFEQVLLYEPLDLKHIRSTLKDIGLLYDANDLISFFDKHCITFRTENSRNKKPKPSNVTTATS